MSHIDNTNFQKNQKLTIQFESIFKQKKEQQYDGKRNYHLFNLTATVREVQQPQLKLYISLTYTTPQNKKLTIEFEHEFLEQIQNISKVSTRDSLYTAIFSSTLYKKG